MGRARERRHFSNHHIYKLLIGVLVSVGGCVGSEELLDCQAFVGSSQSGVWSGVAVGRRVGVGVGVEVFR